MTEKTRYDREYLERYCKDNDIKYENIDESVKIGRDTRIKGHCKSENCDEMFEKGIKSLAIISGPFCLKCTQLFRKEKVKRTNVERYGVEHTFQSEKVKDKIKETNLEKYGVEYASKSEQVKEKTKKSCLKKYGVEHSLQSKEVRYKGKQTCLEKYGVEHNSQSQDIKQKKIDTVFSNFGVCNPMQSEQVKDKFKNSCIEKYGVEHPGKSDQVKEKRKQTCFEKYGVEYSLQSTYIKNKIKQTCFEKYGVENASQSNLIKQKKITSCMKNLGVEHPGQSEQVKEKTKQTCLKKYGVEYVTQNTDILERACKNGYRLKDYTFPSGKVIKCQGYEPFALDILITNHKITEEDIVTSKKEVPEIWYKDSDDKVHRYYVDIFIKSLNKFIEVKSTWTYKKNMEKVELTKNTVKEKGFLYECWVFDGKGNVIETIQ